MEPQRNINIRNTTKIFKSHLFTDIVLGTYYLAISYKWSNKYCKIRSIGYSENAQEGLFF